MKKIVILIPLLFYISSLAEAQRTTMNLNGMWDFEQTKMAFPPKKFTRKIPVPGLVTLAKPAVEQYKKFLDDPQDQPRYSSTNLNYTPKYSWYRLQVNIPASLKGSNAILTLLKSKYGTEVYINGKDMGGSMASFTPIDVSVTDALKYGSENEILVRVGDLTQLPIQAPGIMDFEKRHYFSGIWDSVYLSFTGNFRVHRMLALPSLSDNKLTTKISVRSFYPTNRAGYKYGHIVSDTCKVGITIREKNTGKVIVRRKKAIMATRKERTIAQVTIPMKNAHLWNPDDPFLYTAEVKLYDHGKVSDDTTSTFGMRDFKRKGKHFYLNGKKIYLRGSNITLHRFFEDPDSKHLPWNRKWVTNLLSNTPEKLHWNAMRICVGIVPKFWYDVADSLGIMLQNERLYWKGYNQSSAWRNETRKEYTDWVWSDGNHPSVVIWDAMNESFNTYIGQQLIPKLKQLDSTRIWDNGYMTQQDMLPRQIDDMDEPHLYQVYGLRKNFREYYINHPYPLGNLDYLPDRLEQSLNRGAAQVVNEYGWMWLWRNGEPAKLMGDIYPFYLGENSTTSQRRFFQAYWLQLQTEWLRSHRALAGVLAFDYLSNNYGYTGDWFLGDIKNLTPGPTLKWFRDAFSPSAVFVDLTDERYVKQSSLHDPGSVLSFNLVGVNDYDYSVSGKVTLKLLDAKGKQVGKVITKKVTVSAYGKKLLPTSIQLPKQKGGYLVLAKFQPDNKNENTPIISRRYIKVGKLENYKYFNYISESFDRAKK